MRCSDRLHHRPPRRPSRLNPETANCFRGKELLFEGAWASARASRRANPPAPAGTTLDTSTWDHGPFHNEPRRRRQEPLRLSVARCARLPVTYAPKAFARDLIPLARKRRPLVLGRS